MTPCGICGQRPDMCGDLPDDFREVVTRNGRITRACLRCWFLWPDDHKLYPRNGYGRIPYALTKNEVYDFAGSVGSPTVPTEGESTAADFPDPASASAGPHLEGAEATPQ